MPTVCMTSFSFSYLAKARVLAETLRRHHPGWAFCAVITDRPPEGFEIDADAERFDVVIWGDELFGAETHDWLFLHDVVEACTAVKGAAMVRLLEMGFQKVFYLDPDTAVFESLKPLEDLLETNSILLIPHQVTPDSRHSAIVDNEVSSLRHGTYNLGFVGVRNNEEGRRFAGWWASRLRNYCYDDIPNGLFTDQKWCDLVPAFFDDVRIVRDPGYNVASWNLNQRSVRIERDGRILVNGSLLRFFHFTKLGPIGDAATIRYADDYPVFELWAWYRLRVRDLTSPEIPSRYWRYATFDDGTPIPKIARTTMRDRRDLQRKFHGLFSTGDDSYFSWLIAEGLLPAVSA